LASANTAIGFDYAQLAGRARCRAGDTFIESYALKEAADCLTRDRDTLLAFRHSLTSRPSTGNACMGRNHLAGSPADAANAVLAAAGYNFNFRSVSAFCTWFSVHLQKFTTVPRHSVRMILHGRLQRLEMKT
jgi:hypothetical protein